MENRVNRLEDCFDVIRAETGDIRVKQAVLQERVDSISDKVEAMGLQINDLHKHFINTKVSLVKTKTKTDWVAKISMLVVASVIGGCISLGFTCVKFQPQEKINVAASH